MRRPHRSIETFDISLMAVVTKAMGAFLVLMLLLMPYYTPGVPGQVAAQLVQQLKETMKKIDELSQQLGGEAGGGGGSGAGGGQVKELKEQTDLSRSLMEKLQGLVNKALEDMSRLEAENKQLTAENKEANDEIASLRQELDKLKANAGLTDRAAYVAVAMTTSGCSEFLLKGTLLQVGSEGTRIFIKNKKPIPPELLLFVDLTDGGDITRTVVTPIAQYQDQGSFSGYVNWANSIILGDPNIGLGDYVVIIRKVDPRAKFKAEGYDWSMMRSSTSDCNLIVTPTIRIGENWFADHPRYVTMKAGAAADMVVAFTVDGQGIRFRMPSDGERKWFDGLMVRTLKLQDATPEAKAFYAAQKKSADEVAAKQLEAERAAREEADRKARETAERQAHEAADSKAKDDADRKAEAEAELRKLMELRLKKEQEQRNQDPKKEETK